MNEFAEQLLGDGATWDVWKCSKTGDYFVGSKCHTLLYARVHHDAPISHLSQVVEAWRNGVAHGAYVTREIMKRGEL